MSIVEIKKVRIIPKKTKSVVIKKFNKKKSAQSNILRKNKYLIADNAYATENEIKKILNHCINDKSHESYTLLLSLLFGRKLSELINLKVKIQPNKYHILSYKYNLKKKKKIPKDFLKNLYIPDDTVELPLYEKLIGDISRENNLVNKNKFKMYISEINKELKIKMTTNRISNYLSYWMINNGIDSSKIAIINGENEDMSSGIHYYSVSKKAIIKPYLDFLNHLLSLTSEKEKIKLEEIPAKFKIDMYGFLGSTFTLKNKYVSKLFNLISHNILQIKTNSSKNIAIRHNWYTIYTIFIMNLSTGHRPVNDPYNFLDNIDLTSRTLYICDKKRNKALPYRIGILTELAKKQFNNYLEYLLILKQKYRYFIPGLNQKLSDIFDSESSIFFFIINNKIKGADNKRITRLVKDILPIVPTWHRHFMRSNLSKKNVQGQLIDMWMGHDGRGDYGLAKYSRMSLNDQFKVSEIVEEILQELNLKSIKINE